MGSNTTRNMQVLNLRREFELLRMKESEKVKEYVDRLMSAINKIRLLGVELTDIRVVEKAIVSLPERFESKISSLEDSKDMSQITLTELVHALQAQEQRRLLRQEDTSEGAMIANKKGKPISNEAWLIDSGCTNHTAEDLHKFINLDKLYSSRVKIGNGDSVEVKGIGDVAIQIQSGTKIIPNVLYVPEINQNLLSVGQMLEKGYSLHFQNQACVILDGDGNELMCVKMMGKSFSIEWKKPGNLALTSRLEES
ncbi:uncharacterized protein LOC116140401 [Pistacia vera]|uniref:uncharacterized protein LOC116140401 n=1 Tax=Pistacia vera TaxID=55513 RepID=UPI001262D2F8|nr:uncharacterized protein LOC116140401 [Pistacia vera]